LIAYHREIHMTKPHLLVAVIAAAALAALPARAHAGSILNVSVNTSSISGQSQSEVVFEFSDGDQSGSSNNTATLSSFNLGGGTAQAVDTTNSTGPYSGSLGSGLTLQDGTPITVFGQFFDPGSLLSFTLDLTTNPEAGSTPDEFSMYIYDPSGNPLAPTSDPNGFDSLLSVDINSASPSPNVYSPQLVTAALAPATSAPEPSSLALAATGLLAVLGLAAYRGREARHRA
jgi:hypothetical protein